MNRSYPQAAWRRAMKVQEVLLKWLAGELTAVEAEEILDYTPRHLYRLRAKYREQGFEGLIDRRRGHPSSKKASLEEVQQVLQLYWDNYRGFNAQHAYEKLSELHGVKYRYTWVKNVLQEAGYVKRGKGRGGHRKRRERRPLFGQLVHLDGSEHEWLALRPGEKQVLLLVIDDATGWNLAGELVAGETTSTCLRIMRQVVEEHGIPAQLYTDRDSVYWLTRKGGQVDRERLTQFGRAMEQLGVEMIAAYSPQARGRGERWNGTWQGRLVNELRAARIDNVAAANRYIREVFLPEMNRRFTVEAAEAGSAFVSARGADLERIFAWRYKRLVAADNTVRVNGLLLQIEPSPYRTSFAKCQVEVYRHLDGTYSVDWQHRCVGRYDDKGKNLSASPPPVPQRGKRQRSMPEGERDAGGMTAAPRKREPGGSPSVYAPE